MKQKELERFLKYEDFYLNFFKSEIKTLEILRKIFSFGIIFFALYIINEICFYKISLNLIILFVPFIVFSIIYLVINFKLEKNKIKYALAKEEAYPKIFRP